MGHINMATHSSITASVYYSTNVPIMPVDNQKLFTILYDEFESNIWKKYRDEEELGRFGPVSVIDR